MWSMIGNVFGWSRKMKPACFYRWLILENQNQSIINLKT